MRSSFGHCMLGNVASVLYPEYLFAFNLLEKLSIITWWKENWISRNRMPLATI